MSMTRRDVLGKCIVVFEAIRRAASKGNAGLEPERGAEGSFRTDSEILDVLREMVRELEAGKQAEESDLTEELRAQILRPWQYEVISRPPEELKL